MDSKSKRNNAPIFIPANRLSALLDLSVKKRVKKGEWRRAKGVNQDAGHPDFFPTTALRKEKCNGDACLSARRRPARGPISMKRG
jgi:hypothetical protein